MSEKLSDRLLYAAHRRCHCGYGFAYDREGKICTESGSPFAMRPDQWECAGTLLYRAGELSDSEAARMLVAIHERPISFAGGEDITPERHGQPEPSTREPILPLESKRPRPRQQGEQAHD